MQMDVVVLFGRGIITQSEIKSEQYEKKKWESSSVTASCE